MADTQSITLAGISDYSNAGDAVADFHSEKDFRMIAIYPRQRLYSRCNKRDIIATGGAREIKIRYAKMERVVFVTLSGIPGVGKSEVNVDRATHILDPEWLRKRAT